MSKFLKQQTRRDGVYFIDDRKLASVTDVCSVIAKPYLIKWAAKLAAAAVLREPEKYDTAEKAAAVVDQTKGDAGDRGRAVHKAIESWARGEARPPMDDELEGYGRAWDNFVRSWRPTPMFIECIVVNKTHGYAGRLDIVAQIGAETWILDAKTAKAVWPEYGLQLSAYRNAEEMLVGEQKTVHAMPTVDHAGVVLLAKNGTFQFSEVENEFEDFLAALRLHGWKARHD